VEERQKKFETDNAAINKEYETAIADPKRYEAKLRAGGMSGEQVSKTMDRLLKYGDQKMAFTTEWLALSDKFEKERMSSGQEFNRADRFVKMAGGEKAVVLFGADHLNNEQDMDEMLNLRSKADAFMRGKGDQWAPTKVMDIYPSYRAFTADLNFGATETEDARYYADEKKGELTEDGQKAFAETTPQTYAARPAP
jgi:hypothetical protein